MKLIKNGIDIKKRSQDRINANKDCDICPCCGENKFVQNNIWDEYMKNKKWLYKDTPKGIRCRVKILQLYSMFQRKTYAIDKYECLTCGSQWESEPYEYYSRRMKYESIY